MITEANFTEYRRKVADCPDNIYTQKGTIPVLLSVPHAVPHTREGALKQEEINTDVLAFAVNEASGCHLFINTGVAGDPNHDESNPYKDKLVQYAAEHGIALVIDIHGASSDKDFDFEIGTAGGRNLCGFDESVSAFLALSSLSGNKTTVDTVFPAYNHVRVASHVSGISGIPAIQLEINRRCRDDIQSISAAAAMLSRYVTGIAALAQKADRHEYRLLWTLKADMFVPRNLVILPEELKDTFGPNECVYLHFAACKEDFVIKGFTAPEGCVRLTGQVLSRFGCEDGYTLLHLHTYSTHSVLKPQAEDIDNEHALLSDDLYEKYKDYDMLEVLNPVDNLRSYFKIKRYVGNVNKRIDSVWLSYYQRKLLGIEAPPKISYDYMVVLLSRMNEDDAEFFKKQYLYDEHDECYVRTSANVDATPRLRSIWGKIYSGIRFIGVHAPSGGIKQNFIMERLIRKNTIQFRAARCADSNEIVDAVFITKSSSIALGVSELDHVWIAHEDKTVRTKVVIMDKDDYSKIVKANCLKSDEELDMLVCIPMKLRIRLGIYEPGASVMVERSVKDIFIKSAFAQMMTLLGLFIAIVTIPDIGVVQKSIIFAILVPILIYSVLAGERNKI